MHRPRSNGVRKMESPDIKDWFYNYFDETYKRIEEAREKTGCKDIEREVEFIIKVTKMEEKGNLRVLDIGCGWGKHAIEIKKKLGEKIDITGIELNKKFIDIAKHESKKQNINIRWLQGDMREVLPTLQDFDVVYMIGGTFGYFSDRENIDVLKNNFRLLKKEGVFLFDTTNRDKLCKVFTETYWTKVITPDGDIMVLYNDYFTSKEGMLYSERTFIVNGKMKVKNLRIRVYNFTELKKILDDIGFRFQNVWGWYDFSPFEFNSNKMIFLVSKGE